jgi:glyoxylase I family protein
MIKGIEHTAIASPNPQRLAQWYIERLGFVNNFGTPDGKILFLKAPDGSMIEVIEASGAAAQPAQLKDPGIRHLALAVGDFDAAYASLQAAGISFLLPKTTVSGNTTAFFTDCDGNILHLLHREKPLP